MRTKKQIKDYLKLWHRFHPEYNRIHSRIWRKLNHKKSLKYQRIYQRKWRIKNRKRSREIIKKCYYTNHLRRLADRRKYYRENKKKENKYRVKLAMMKYHSDPNQWIIMNLRSRLLRILNMGTKKIKKTSHSFQLFGANVDVIKRCLESQFKKGMNWNNRGKWHIDHIKPLSSFNLRKTSEQRKAFHYTNLQPLWAIDNLKKGNK